jgi:N-acetylmuramoyl-L-alanine amidase
LIGNIAMRTFMADFASAHVIPSPNHESRDGQAVDMLVLHYTGMKSAAAAIDKLIDPQAKVSAHYVVDEQGVVFQLVPESERAWHAGKSYWRGNTNINQRSIGIEIVNPGHEFGYRPFPEIQMQRVIALCKDILARHDIPAHNVVGHSDVAPTRKQDPGELFDWEWLAEEGIGLGVTKNEPVGESALSVSGANSPCDFQQKIKGQLKQFGYDTTDLNAAIITFQRHFRQSNISGEWDEECTEILKKLLASDF